MFNYENKNEKKNKKGERSDKLISKYSILNQIKYKLKRPLDQQI